MPYFPEYIVDPNAIVGEQYQLNVSSLLPGIAEEESPTALAVRTVTESVIAPKGDVKARQKLAQSLMPAGMLEAFSERKAIGLLKSPTGKP